MLLNDDCWQIVIGHLHDDNESLLALCTVSHSVFAMAAKVLYRHCLDPTHCRYSSDARSGSDQAKLDHLLNLTSGYSQLVNLPAPTWPDPVTLPTMMDYSKLVQIPTFSDTTMGDQWIDYLQCLASAVVNLTIHASKIELILPLADKMSSLKTMLLMPDSPSITIDQHVGMAVQFLQAHQMSSPNGLQEVKVEHQHEDWASYLKLQSALGKVQAVTLTKYVADDESFFANVCVDRLQTLRFQGEANVHLGSLLAQCRALKHLTLFNVHPESLQWAVEEKNHCQDSCFGRPLQLASSSLPRWRQLVQIKTIDISGPLDLIKDAFEGFQLSLEQAEYKPMPVPVTHYAVNTPSSSSPALTFSWACPMPRLSCLTFHYTTVDLDSLKHCPRLCRLEIDHQPGESAVGWTPKTLANLALTHLTLLDNSATLFDFISLKDLVHLQDLNLDSRTPRFPRFGVRPLDIDSQPQLTTIDMTGWQLPSLKSAVLTFSNADQAQGQMLRVAPKLERLTLGFDPRQGRTRNLDIKTFWPLQAAAAGSSGEDGQKQDVSQCYPNLTYLKIQNANIPDEDQVSFEAFFGSIAPPPPPVPVSEDVKKEIVPESFPIPLPSSDLPGQVVAESLPVPLLFSENVQEEVVPTSFPAQSLSFSDLQEETLQEPTSLPVTLLPLSNDLQEPVLPNPVPQPADEDEGIVIFRASYAVTFIPVEPAKPGTAGPSMVPNLKHLHLCEFNFFPCLDRIILHVLAQPKTQEVWMEGRDAGLTGSLMEEKIAPVVHKSRMDGSQRHLAIFRQQEYGDDQKKYVLKSQWPEWVDHVVAVEIKE